LSLRKKNYYKETVGHNAATKLIAKAQKEPLEKSVFKEFVS
jgi:hypothetical protein